MGLHKGRSSFSRAMYFTTRNLENMLLYKGDDVNIYCKRPQPASFNEILHQRHFDSVRQFSTDVSKLKYGSTVKSVIWELQYSILRSYYIPGRNSSSSRKGRRSSFYAALHHAD